MALHSTRECVEVLERAGQLRRIEHKIDPSSALRRPLRYLGVPFTLLNALPRTVRGGPVLSATCKLSELPQIKSWPDDGGPFITLPQVYTEDPAQPGPLRSNLGMYRV